VTGLEVAMELRTLIVGACAVVASAHIGITFYALVVRGVRMAGRA
jgi:hypothetical protein